MFVDDLALQEGLLVIVTLMLAFVGITTFLAMTKRDTPGVREHLRTAAVPLGILGSVSLGLALWGEVAWPLPGSYNIFFTDIYLLFGMVTVALAFSLWRGLKLQYVGLFSFAAGAMTMAYGWNGYVANLTKDPTWTLLLYGAFGLMAILAFPVTLVVDDYLTRAKPLQMVSNVIIVLFLVSVVLAFIAALWYLDSTLPAHLASAP